MFSMEVGLRVVRGPNWKWDNQDGGEGHVGTVVEIGKHGSSTDPDKTVVVQWDCGSRTNCRVGYEGAYDLRIVDSAPAYVCHRGIYCSECGKEPLLWGMRWKCKRCLNFNLCTKCYMSDKHDLTHPFLRLETEDSPEVKLPKRQGATKLQMRGIFKSAKVVRGFHWNSDNHDGGDGKIGEVLDIGPDPSTVYVTWPDGTKKRYHRYAELKYKQVAAGGFYYRDHLPVLGEDKSLDPTLEPNVSVVESRKRKLSDENKALHDLKKLFLSNEACDAVITVKGNKFSAHKAILIARSPVFASKFRNDMTEKCTDVINCDDCDPSSFSDFLSFLYSGEVENLSSENVSSLLIVAKKYDVQDLRSVCLKFMKENLSIDAFCDTLSLALQHSEEELVTSCKDFFSKNFKEIIKTTRWQSFLDDYPIQSNKLFMNALAGEDCDENE